MQTYYAIAYTYGVASNPDGTRCGTYYAIASRRKRDTWVAQTAGIPRTGAGFREAVRADRETAGLVYVPSATYEEDGAVGRYVGI